MDKMSASRDPRLFARQIHDGSQSALRQRRRLRTGRVLIVLIGMVVSGFAGTARGDNEDGDKSNGAGFMSRIGHIEGQGVPQFQSLTPVELFPYLVNDNSMFFSDLRFFPTNNFTFGGNAGLGYRYFSEDWDRVFGVSTWYDGDNTRNVYFQQLGLSLETYGGPFDFRSNFYLPVGPTTRQTALDVINGTVQFSGANLVYDQYRQWYTAMKGFDMEAGTPLPGEFSAVHALRVYGGGYYYRDDQGNSITGASTRLQANLFSGLDAQVQVTYDPFFKTRAFVGFSWTFGSRHPPEINSTSAYARLGEHVTRNYTVLAPQRSAIEQVAAVDPSTGLPYTFAHVSSAAAAGGNGSNASPFQTLAAAAASNREIIYAHSGSVFNGAPSLVLNPGQRLLGDGSNAQYYLPLQGGGSILVPHGATAGNLPVINGSIGNAVVMANNTQLSGFSITNAGGSAVLASGVHDVSLSNLNINHSGLDGLRLLNNPGSVSVNNIYIANSGGAGIDIQGGGGLVQFLGTTTVATPAGAGINIFGGSGLRQFAGTTTVSGSAGPAVSIANLASTAGVTFENLAIDHRQGRGIEINAVAGNVNATGTTNISNELASTASALDVRNSSGTFNFNTVNIDSATGAPGVNLQNSTGTTVFQTLNLNSHSGTALSAVNAGGLVINGAVNGSVDLTKGGSINAVGGTAVNVQNTDLNVNLQSVSSSGAATGISLLNTTGLFAVFGNGTVGSGGTIQGAGTGILLQNAGLSGFQWMTLNANGVGIRATNVVDLAVSSTSITNSTGFGIDALNTSAMTITNSAFSGNGGINLRAQFSTPNAYAYALNGSQFLSSSADNAVFTVLGGGEGSTLNLQAHGDTFTNTLGGMHGINVNWNGTVGAQIDQSLFTVSGGNNTGVLVQNASATGFSTFSLTNSGFQSNGGNDTGFRIITAGPAALTLTGNTLNFGAANDVGFRTSLGASSTVNLAKNTLTDSVGGATGFLFDSLTGPGSVTINDNLMNLTTVGSDQGIVFSTITNTIQLLGTDDNHILNATTPFFIPFGTTTGSFFVNGTPVP